MRSGRTPLCCAVPCCAVLCCWGGRSSEGCRGRRWAVRSGLVNHQRQSDVGSWEDERSGAAMSVVDEQVKKERRSPEQRSSAVQPSAVQQRQQGAGTRYTRSHPGCPPVLNERSRAGLPLVTPYHKRLPDAGPNQVCHNQCKHRPRRPEQQHDPVLMSSAESTNTSTGTTT